MAIDDKYDALDKAFPETGPYLPEELAALALKLMLPGSVTNVLGVVCGRLRPQAQLQRAMETLRLLVSDMKDAKAKLADAKKQLDELKEAMQLVVRYDVDEFNDTKRKRYVT